MSVSVISRIEADWLSFLPHNEHIEFIFCLGAAIFTDDHSGAKGTQYISLA